MQRMHGTNAAFAPGLVLCEPGDCVHALSLNLEATCMLVLFLEMHRHHFFKGRVQARGIAFSYSLISSTDTSSDYTNDTQRLRTVAPGLRAAPASMLHHTQQPYSHVGKRLSMNCFRRSADCRQESSSPSAATHWCCMNHISPPLHIL